MRLLGHAFAARVRKLIHVATVAVWFGIINAAREITKRVGDLPPRTAAEFADRAVRAFEDLVLTLLV